MRERNERNITYDIARFLCMFWIVAIWHMVAYLDMDGNVIKNWGGHYLTTSCLSCFACLSGLFLGKKQLSVRAFYYNRFVRFYLLLLIACLTMKFGGWMDSWTQVVTTMTGLSSFILPQPKTIWFISMMISFYAITPLLLPHINKKHREMRILLRGIVVFLLLCILECFHPIDGRVPGLFAFYVLGLALPFPIVERFTVNTTVAVPATFIASVLIFDLINHYDLVDYRGLELLGNFCGSWCIISMSVAISRLCKGQLCKDLAFLGSYISLSAYLFHRHVFKIFRIVFGDNDGIMPVWLWPIIIITVFVVSYIIQRLYDGMVDKILNRNKL